MAHEPTKLIQCQICKNSKRMNEVYPAELVRSPVVALIKADHPDWNPQGVICYTDLNLYRSRFVESSLISEKGELSSLECEVIQSLKDQESLSENINDTYDSQATFGERIADKVAEFGGSWSFIFMFAGVLLVWVLLNSSFLLLKPFDPYPFIFLNLILSCVAAVQAPVIMMSQNRHDAKDRLRSEHDYQVNLKAELEIRHISAKLDMLLSHHWQRLLEIQQIQIEQNEEMRQEINGKRKP